MSRGIVLHNEVKAAFKVLTLLQRGELITALLEWSDGNGYEFDDKTLVPFWGWLKSKQIEINSKYEEQCKLRSEYGKKGANSKWLKMAKDGKPSQDIAEDDSTCQKMQNQNQNQNQRSTNVDTSVTSTEEKKELSLIPETVKKITWDRELGGFAGIDDADMAAWQKTFAKVGVEQELAAAEQWLRDNPRRMKKDLKRFIGGWLRRAHADEERTCGGRRTEVGGRRSEREPMMNQGGLLV